MYINTNFIKLLSHTYKWFSIANSPVYKLAYIYKYLIKMT